MFEDEVWSLKPCPFCGDKMPVVVVGTEGHAVICGIHSCNAMIGWTVSDQEAVRRWNRRSSPRV